MTRMFPVILLENLSALHEAPEENVLSVKTVSFHTRLHMIAHTPLRSPCLESIDSPSKRLIASVNTSL